MVDYYISYYYNDVKDFNAMYNNYLSIVKSIFKNEKININQEFKNKLKNAIDEEEIKEKKYFNGYYRSYPLTIDRSGISFEYNFKLITSIRSAAYKNIFSTYIGLGGMP